MISKENLQKGMETLISIGPKLTGSAGQLAFIDYLKAEIRALGLPVYADPFYFDRWQATGASLSLIGEDGEETPLHISSVHPYSGETPEEGVTAPLLYLSGIDKAIKAEGKIVVMKIEDLGKIPSEIAFDMRSAYPADTTMPAFYNGPVATAMVRCLAEGALKLLKPAAAVFVWEGIPDAAVEGQWMPFIQDYLGLPVVWLNASDGETLIAAAKEKRTARFVLTAEKEKLAYTETFYTIVEGEEKGECVIVNTHTDGPNAVEENGGVALLELLRHVAAKKPRRTHIFLFTTGHFRLPVFKDIRTGGFQSASRWLQYHRNLWDGKCNHLKCVANLAVEHLGCLEWLVEDGQYVGTGKPDVEMVYTGNKYMDALYIETVKEHRRNTRSMTLKGHNMLHFGEGQNFFTMGIPGVCLVPGPYYLCVESPTMEVEKFDLDLMAEQTETFLRLIEKLEAADSADFGRSEGYSFVFAHSVSGGDGFQPGHFVRRLVGSMKAGRGAEEPNS